MILPDSTFSLLLLASAGLGFAGCAPAAREAPPNILFIVSDQHNARAMGCAGNPQVQTPNLDRLAQEGVRFSAAFCQTAQCSPSRFSIWTGRHTRSHGLRRNFVREPLEETTFAEVLRDAGYATASIGKHHMTRSPEKHGFDEVVQMRDFQAFVQEQTERTWFGSLNWAPGLGPEAPVGAGTSPLGGDLHPTGFWATKAIDFLRTSTERPFCLWLSFYGPHPPIAPSREFAELYRPEEMELPPSFGSAPERAPRMFEQARAEYASFDEEQHRTLLARYYGLVTQIDFNIGRVLDELDRLGLTENTVVVFTSDHGEMMGEHRMWKKHYLNLEGTVRVPLLVRGPGCERGAVRDELVGLIDLMPTALDLCALDTPESVQGRSLAPLLAGKQVEWRDVIFSEIGIPGHGRRGCSLMARSRTRKYLRHENPQGDEPYEQLFDLERDPWEMEDEIANEAYAADAAELRRELAAWEERTESAPLLPMAPVPDEAKDE